MELQPEYCKFGYDCYKPLKNPAIVYLRKCFVQYPLIGTYILSTVPLYCFFRVARDFYSAELRARKHCPDEGDCRGPESGIHVPRQVQS